MKLRFKVENRGWYIPQYLNKDDEWTNFTLGDLGDKNTQIHIVTYILGKQDRWNGNTYHFIPTEKTDKKENMPLIFENEIKCAAFLGAAKLYFSERTKELNL